MRSLSPAAQPGASRGSSAAATVMPGRETVSRSNSDHAGGSGSVGDACRTVRRLGRRTALIAASSPAANACGVGGSGVATAVPGLLEGPTKSFTELTIWRSRLRRRVRAEWPVDLVKCAVWFASAWVDTAR